MRDLLRSVSRLFPKFVMHGGDRTPYLSRYKLYEGGDDGYRLFLHQFHRGDSDREVHNHPWSWAVSLILAGSYEEERVVEGKHLSADAGGGRWLIDGLHLSKRLFTAGSLNFIDTDTYHRINLPDGEAWSIILSGPKNSPWGFVRLSDWKYTPWREFIQAKGLETVAEEGPSRWKVPELDVRRTISEWVARKLSAYGHYPIPSDLFQKEPT